MQKVLKANFAAAWEELGEDNQVEDTYALSSVKTLQGFSPLALLSILFSN